VRRDAIHFNLQVAHAASLQKRDLITDGINFALQSVNQIQQQIQAGIIQAQNMILGLQNQTASLIVSVTADLQATATTILTQVASIPGCTVAQTPVVANIVTQAGMLLHQLYYILVTITVKSCEYGYEHSASVRTVQHFA
jgi:hypothetical protein